MDIFGLPRPKDVRMGWTSAFDTNEMKLGQRLLRTDTIYGNSHLQKGDGLFSSVSQVLGKAVTAVRNTAPSSDENARPLFEGEHHAVLSVNGRPANANYMGPGTHVVQRIMRGDPPRSESDKVAQAHDLRYQLGVDEREADNKMLAKLGAIRQQRTDSDFNVNMGTLPIRAKIEGENRGVLRKGKFSSKKDPMTTQEEGVLREKLKSLEQEGYGLGLVGGCKDPMMAPPPRPKRKPKAPPLPGEELLSSLHQNTKKRKAQTGRGVGQRGRGISSGVANEPYGGSWMSGEWQNAIAKKPRVSQIGNGIGAEPYAGSWLSGEWQNSLTGSGLKGVKGASNEPYGGSWLQGEWQSQTGMGPKTRSHGPASQPDELPRVVRRRNPPRRQSPASRARPPAPPPSPSERDTPRIDSTRPESTGRWSLPSNDSPRPQSRLPASDPLSVFRAVAIRPEAHRPPRPPPARPASRPPIDEQMHNMLEVYNAIDRGDAGYLDLRRKAGLLTSKYHTVPSEYYKKTAIPHQAKRYQSGNRPLLDSAHLYTNDDGLPRPVIHVDPRNKAVWDRMNAGEKRQALLEGTPEVNDDRYNFYKRMVQGKRNKYAAFPWLKQFQLEITRFIIPVLLSSIQHTTRNPPRNIHDIATKFMDIVQLYRDEERFGQEGWRNGNPHAKGATYDADGTPHIVMEQVDVDQARSIAEARGSRRRNEEIDEALGRRGRGLKLAGQGKLGRRLNAALKEKSHHEHHIGKAAAKHISKVLIEHLKGRGCSIPNGLGQNFTDYLTEPMVCRVQQHMCGNENEAHQAGSGFWHSFVEGFKSIGVPILKAVATVAPLLL